MRLLFVIDYLGTGGAQRQMVSLALGLNRRGHKVEFFCYQPGDLLAQPLYDAGIPVHWHLKRGRFSFDVILALKRLIDRAQYELVLSFLPTPNFYAICAGRLLPLRRVPVVVSERRCELPERSGLAERFSRQFYRLAARVVTNSHHRRMDLAKRYPWMSSHLSTIYNGYDLNQFTLGTEPAPHGPLVILAVAHVSPHKNGMCLVEALNILRQRDGLLPQVHWIGRLGMQGIELAYLNEMQQAIQRHGLGQQWEWIGQRTDMVEQFQSHDVLVHPSYGEGLPNVVCEALACGRPVILSDTLDHARLVQDGESGYLFNYQDPADLADKLKQFMCLPRNEREKMGAAGRRFAEANLSLERLVDEYEHLFQDLQQ